MPLQTITTGDRCDHGTDAAACPFCAVELRATGHRATRHARRVAASVRRALRDAERERDTLRGYRYLSGTVSAYGATSPVLIGMGNAADVIGDAFYADVTGETVERVARYIGARDTDAERVHAVLLSDGSPVSYAARLARRVARSVARGTGTGRGTMPRFTVPDAERELARLYRERLRDVPAFTLSDGNGSRRAMTDAERELVLVTVRPERVERSPLYAAWLDGMGDGLPDVRDGHGTGHVAPYVPERDAAPLRHGSIFERARAVGADGATVRALRAIFDIVNVPDGHGRYRSRVPWSDVRDVIGATVSPDTVARRVRATVNAVRARELDERRPDGRPFTLSDASPVVTTRLFPIGTGRYRGTGRRDTSPVVAPSVRVSRAPRTVRHYDGTVTAETFTTGTVITGNASPELPLWTGTVCPCDVPNNGAHRETCPVRVARAQRVARWGTISPRARWDTVRALVDQNATERGTMGT